MLTGDVLETGMSGLDVYDPNFEEELSTLWDDALSGSTDEYGFTTETQSSVETWVVSDSQNVTWSSSKSELYNLIIKKSVKK